MHKKMNYIHCLSFTQKLKILLEIWKKVAIIRSIMFRVVIVRTIMTRSRKFLRRNKHEEINGCPFGSASLCFSHLCLWR